MGIKEDIQCWLFGAIQSEYIIKAPNGTFVRGTNSGGQYMAIKQFLATKSSHSIAIEDPPWKYYKEQGYSCVEIIEKPVTYITLRDLIRNIIGWVNKRTGRIMSHGIKGYLEDRNV